MTEKEMKDTEVPWLKTEEELIAYIQEMTKAADDYGTAIYAMSMVAVAAFYYMSHKVEASGFQASCAELDIIKRTRGLKHGFSLVDYGNLLYPQYCNAELFPDHTTLLQDTEIREHLAKEAQKLLAENKVVHSEVKAHWEMLVEMGVTDGND